MNSYFVTLAYSLLDVIKYLMCIIFIFNIPIRNKKISIPIWLLMSVAFCLGDFAFNQYGGLFFFIPNICALFLVCFFDKKYKIKGALFIVLSWVIMDSLSELIKLLLSFISGSNDYILGSIYANNLLDKIIVLFIPLFYHIFVNMLIKKKVDYSLYPFQWVIIIICFAGSLLIIPSIENIIKGKTVDSTSYIIMCISLITILFLFIFILVWQSYVMRKNVLMKREELRYQYMLRTQSDYFDGLLKNDQEIRKFRHDMCAHIAALREYAKGNNDEKMLEYLSRMEEKANVSKVKKYTGNRAVDAVINDQIHLMEEKNIKFNYEGFYRSREDINEFDLCTIFYNLIKNAIEACDKVDIPEKSIDVKVKSIGNKLGISVGNDTILEEIPENGILQTTKADKINHGLGTRSVREVVDKHDGVYVINIINRRFITEIII